MYIFNQKFLVAGISRSGFAVAKYLLENGVECFLFDQSNSEKVKSNVETLISMGGIVSNGSDIEETLNKIDVLVVSPGIPINHPICISAKNKGKRIVGELEFAFMQFVPPTVAVTGTNGKTTTVSMIHCILKSANKKSVLIGNVGVPVTEELGNVDKSTVCITEVSSFQLETINSFCPHIACILNIQPDHLERHYTMENYVFLKKRLIKNLKNSEYAVLNFDDERVKSFANDINSKILFVSLKEKTDGAYILNDCIYFNEENIMPVSDLTVSGSHNYQNALFSVVVCKLLGLTNKQIRDGLISFKGVKHRIELVYENNEVKYFNDSKSTNTTSTITALSAMKGETVLILGGSEKGESYNLLFEKIKNSPVRHVVLTGASRYKMLDAAISANVSDISVTGNFETAIKTACIFASSGDNVLFSPACASFDNFSDYKERGERFTKIVEEFC